MIASTTLSQQQTLLCDRESLREWKVTMRTSNTRTRKFSSTVGTIVMALVVASMIGGISIAPAFGKDHDKRASTSSSRSIFAREGILYVGRPSAQGLGTLRQSRSPLLRVGGSYMRMPGGTQKM